jgi:putative FmdB family regulatory protein
MTYEYVCTACGHAWEAEQPISAKALTECPSCHAETAKRQVSGGAGFILKGGGWYADLYGSPQKKSNEPAAGDSKAKTAEPNKTDSSSKSTGTEATPAKSSDSGSSGGGDKSSSGGDKKAGTKPSGAAA